MENKWDVLMKNDYPQNEYYIYIRRRGGGMGGMGGGLRMT